MSHPPTTIPVTLLKHDHDRSLIKDAFFGTDRNRDLASHNIVGRKKHSAVQLRVQVSDGLEDLRSRTWAGSRESTLTDEVVLVSLIT